MGSASNSKCCYRFGRDDVGLVALVAKCRDSSLRHASFRMTVVLLGFGLKMLLPQESLPPGLPGADTYLGMFGDSFHVVECGAFRPDVPANDFVAGRADEIEAQARLNNFRCWKAVHFRATKLSGCSSKSGHGGTPLSGEIVNVSSHKYQPQLNNGHSTFWLRGHPVWPKS